MKVLFLTKYSRQGASSRMRSYQYFSDLERQGIELHCEPLFGDGYLASLYRGASTGKYLIFAYIKRFFLLFTLFRYDRLVIEKELFPYMPALFERMLKMFGIKYIVDYDDAIFHNYDQHPNGLIRWVLKGKIDQVMKMSSRVVCGNSYLAARAIVAGAERVHIIPTVVDLSRYGLKQHAQGDEVIIGWIGTRSTFEKHYSILRGLINDVAAELPVKFHVIGVPHQGGFGEALHFHPWSEETEVQNILKFDIGIMPLQDSAWEKGKCAYKLIQYMACGIPVIASPVGMNVEVVQEGLTGFLAANEAEWRRKIELLVSDVALRQMTGAAGRALVAEKYCLAQTQPHMLKLIADDI